VEPVGDPNGGGSGIPGNLPKEAQKNASHCAVSKPEKNLVRRKAKTAQSVLSEGDNKEETEKFCPQSGEEKERRKKLTSRRTSFFQAQPSRRKAKLTNEKEVTLICRGAKEEQAGISTLLKLPVVPAGGEETTTGWVPGERKKCLVVCQEPYNEAIAEGQRLRNQPRTGGIIWKEGEAVNEKAESLLTHLKGGIRE